MEKLKKIKKMDMNWHLIFLAIFFVITLLIIVLGSQVPEFKNYLNETVSVTGDFFRTLLRFFTGIFQ